MPNHFHFLIFVKENVEKEIIKQVFSNFFNAYAKSINKMFNRTGSLFQERFGRKYIGNERYFTEVIFYIHGNAPKHGITHDFSTYPYSSYRKLLSNKPTLLQRNEVMEWFGGNAAFINFHKGNMEIQLDYLREIEKILYY
jgi:putative transposase